MAAVVSSVRVLGTENCVVLSSVEAKMEGDSSTGIEPDVDMEGVVVVVVVVAAEASEDDIFANTATVA